LLFTRTLNSFLSVYILSHKTTFINFLKKKEKVESPVVVRVKFVVNKANELKL
jgi:hypothetical protein